MGDPLQLRKFAGDSLYNLIRQGLTILIGLFTSIVFARGLGDAGRGIYALALLLPNLLLNFTSLGVDSSTIYLTAQKKYSQEVLVGGSLLLATLTSLLGLVAGVLLIFFARDLMFAGVPLNLLFLALMLIPIFIFGRILLGVLSGGQDFRAYNAAGIIPEIARFVLAVILVWWLHWGVLGAVVASVLSELLGVFVGAAYVAARSHITLRLIWNKDFVRDALHYGLKVYSGNLVQFLNYRSDKFLVNIFVGNAALGLYDVAVSLAERLWLIPNSIGIVLFPRVTSMENAEEDRVQLTSMVARNILWLSLLIVLIMLPFVDTIIVFLYGEEFRLAGQGLQLLLPGIISLGFSRILANDISGRGHPEINMIHASVALIVNVISNLILIPRLGFMGASISSSISYTLTAMMKVIYYSRLTKSKWTTIVLINRDDFRLWKKAALEIHTRLLELRGQFSAPN